MSQEPGITEVVASPEQHAGHGYFWWMIKDIQRKHSTDDEYQWKRDTGPVIVKPHPVDNDDAAGAKQVCETLGDGRDLTSVIVPAYGQQFQLTGKFLGAGTTAVVYEAVNPGNPTKRAAIKFGLATDDFLHPGSHNYKTRYPTVKPIKDDYSIMKLAQKPLDSPYQTDGYPPVIDTTGQVGDLQAKVPYVVMEEVMPFVCPTINTVQDELDKMIRFYKEQLGEASEASRLAFKSLLYAKGYFYDGIGNTFGFYSNDIRTTNFMLDPQIQKLRMIDFNAAMGDVKGAEERWFQRGIYQGLIDDLISHCPFLPNLGDYFKKNIKRDDTPYSSSWDEFSVKNNGETQWQKVEESNAKYADMLRALKNNPMIAADPFKVKCCEFFADALNFDRKGGSYPPTKDGILKISKALYELSQ